jgi:hypothetical protein
LHEIIVEFLADEECTTNVVAALGLSLNLTKIKFNVRKALNVVQAAIAAIPIEYNFIEIVGHLLRFPVLHVPK